MALNSRRHILIYSEPDATLKALSILLLVRFLLKLR